VATTLANLVDRTIGSLRSYSTNRPQVATFNGWMLDGAGAKVGVNLADVTMINAITNAHVELDTELVHVRSYDAASGDTACPPWFRQQNGTPANDSYPVGSRVTINPLWPRYDVAVKICDGIASLFPDVFVVKTVLLPSTPLSGNYELPSDVDGILHITVEDFGPTRQQYSIGQWSLDTSNEDGKSYLRIQPIGIGGRPIRVEYRAKPVVPDPADLTATWASVGLPDSCADLPILFALYTLIPSADTSKMQSSSIEQSDRSRLVQVGSSTSISRRYQEMYAIRKKDERRKLVDRHPPRIHKTLNG
jgi:hypothetical protein